MPSRRPRKPAQPRPPIINDNISRYLKDFVPNNLQGEDRYLDLITWNIKFFNNRDPQRVKVIISIMQELNADIFVLQEIEEGSLDGIAETLIESGAGLYKTAYGTTGGDQRVAFMYDMEWVKASLSVEELFADENPTVLVERTRKPVFPRLPLHSTFVAYKEEDPFDFHLVGLHLKSQRGGGGEQRSEAAKRLADWIETGTSDEDVIVAGDWNAPPKRPEWAPLRELEVKGEIKFEGFNPADEASYLSVGNRRSRLDLIAVSSSIKAVDIQETSAVVTWNALLETSEGSQRQQLLKQVIDTISDHLPVLTRFYFTDIDPDD